MYYLLYESVLIDFTGEETWLVSKGYTWQIFAKEDAEKILPKGRMMGKDYTWWDCFIYNQVIVMPGNRRLRFATTAKLPQDQAPKIPASRWTNYKLHETALIEIEPPF